MKRYFLFLKNCQLLNIHLFTLAIFFSTEQNSSHHPSHWNKEVLSGFSGDDYETVGDESVFTGEFKPSKPFSAVH